MARELAKSLLLVAAGALAGALATTDNRSNARNSSDLRATVIPPCLSSRQASPHLPNKRPGQAVSPRCEPRPTFISIETTGLEERLIDAIWAVETERGTNLAAGDGGHAHGHLQQHEGHWQRGCEYLGVNWPWPESTYDYDKAKAVAVANWRRDAWPKIEDYLIRHFRLPNDPYRKDNDAYLRKVLAAMERHGCR